MSNSNPPRETSTLGSAGSKVVYGQLCTSGAPPVQACVGLASAVPPKSSNDLAASGKLCVGGPRTQSLLRGSPGRYIGGKNLDSKIHEEFQQLVLKVSCLTGKKQNEMRGYAYIQNAAVDQSADKLGSRIRKQGRAGKVRNRDAS
ncbi:hypothetical protein BDZ91DRAFT_761667 [Kalaharituber pfeilii]|nr:hypothetical protein BDZ91DRAFT_761667 [Kalaharituber pfeilii]